MQQADSESLVPVGGGGDRKIACETFADGYGDTPEERNIPDSSVVEVPPDFPPESFWLSKDAEFDWFDRNAFLERKESTKGNSNSMNLNPNVNPSHSISNSQRYSTTLKSKPAIIGLPKTQKMTYVEAKRRQCKPANIRLFPKRSNSTGKTPTTVLVTEPTSPKVSCIGRVRSKRCRSRRKASVQGPKPEKSASQRSGTSRPHKAGLMSRITSLFRSKGHRRKKNGKPSEKVNEPAENSASRRICVTVKPVHSEPEATSGPAGLGGMMRFASGRRSASWGGSDDDEMVGTRHSSDLGRRGL